MKRLLLPITILLLIFLSACNPGIPIEPNENNMIVTIKNNANFDFYGLQLHMLDHAQTIVNADGSKIEKGQEFKFEFLKEDVELNGEVDMEVFILTDIDIEDDQDQVAINDKVALELASNQEIILELTGDSIEEAALIHH